MILRKITLYCLCICAVLIFANSKSQAQLFLNPSDTAALRMLRVQGFLPAVFSDAQLLAFTQGLTVAQVNNFFPLNGIDLEPHPIIPNNMVVAKLRLGGKRFSILGANPLPLNAHDLDTLFYHNQLAFLKHLDISYNAIADWTTFDTLPLAPTAYQYTLTTLNISRNELCIDAPALAVRAFPNLDTLIADSVCLYPGGHGTSCLSASYGVVPDVDWTLDSILVYIQQYAPSLRTLILSRNTYQSINANATNASLTTLNLSGNHLSGADVLGFFINFPSIKELDLSRNNIAALPPTNSSVSPAILAGNNIPCYSGLDSLQRIDLSYNPLGGQPFAIYKLLGEQLSITPSANRPFKSIYLRNCGLQGFIDSVSFNIDTLLALHPIGLPFFPNLDSICVDSNRLDYYQLLSLALTLNLYNVAGIGYVVTAAAPDHGFDYTPQDTLGIGGVRRRAQNETTRFEIDGQIKHPFVNRLRQVAPDLLNTYKWQWGTAAMLANGTTLQLGSVRHIATGSGISVTTHSDTIVGLLGGVGATNAEIGLTSIQLPMADTFNQTFLFQLIENSNFPRLRLTTRPKKLIQGTCIDSAGRQIRCQEIAVAYHIDSLGANPDSVKRDARSIAGATVIDSCVCGHIEVWAFSDTFQQVNMETNGTGTRTGASTVKTKPALKSADGNYNLLNIEMNGDTTITDPIQGSSGQKALVAFIDSGADIDHPVLNRYIQINPHEIPNNDIDDDNNCEKDDVYGYNYFERNEVPYDDHGHGTKVAGLIAGLSDPSIERNADSIALLPLRYTNYKNEGTSFNAACAIYYASDYYKNNATHPVRVINASWGYHGEHCKVLEDAIRYAGDSSNILFVCAAGNDGQNLESYRHYPSNYPLANIVAVAALDNNDFIASYSNYGRSRADIAALGTIDSTTIPHDSVFRDTLYGANGEQGTSFSTPLVSRAAGILFSEYPTATYCKVKDALLYAAITLPNADSTKLRSGKLPNDLDEARYYLDSLDVLGELDDACGIVDTNDVISPVRRPEVAAGTNALQIQKIAPNPFRTQFTIQLASVDAVNEVQLQFMALDGRVLQQAIYPAATRNLILHTAELPEGMYLLRIQQGNHYTIQKVVKMN